MLGLLGFVLSTVSTLFSGYVVSWLWLWFIVPFGLPEVGIAWAIGLSVLGRALTYMLPTYNPSDEAWPAAANAIVTITVSFIFLILGYIAHLFM